MGDIKSAREIALEKVAELGEATEEERLEWKYGPEGEKLAARYLRRDCDLAAELGRYEKKAVGYVVRSAGELLIKTLGLPAGETAIGNNVRAMEGLETLKAGDTALTDILRRVRNLFSHYMEVGEKQRQQAYAGLKADFKSQLEQAMQQKLGVALETNIDVEKQPQFQEEWRKVQLQLDAQYLKLLDEYKQELREII